MNVSEMLKNVFGVSLLDCIPHSLNSSIFFLIIIGTRHGGKGFVSEYICERFVI